MEDDKERTSDESLSADSDSSDVQGTAPEYIESLMIRAERTIAAWESPLPPPEVLDAYERLYPGAIKWIFSETETQGDHRREMERLILTQAERRANLGTWFAFILGLGILGLTGYTLWTNQPLWGLALVLSTITPMTSAYVYVVQKRRQELRDKADSVPE